MGALGSLVVSLNANIARFESAMTRANYVANQNMKAISDSAKGLQSSIDSLPSSIMRVVGAAAGLTTLVSAFKKGIDAIDEFKRSTISVAATVAEMAQDKNNGPENYARGLAYAKDMYSELELAAARYFASGQEMTQAWNLLAQKGVVLRKEEIDNLGIIVDRIKLATAGQTSGIQIGQELRAVFNGQAKASDQIAMILKDRLGPEWEKIIQKVRETGSLKALADQFSGLSYASKDIQETLESQKSTLGTLLNQVGRAGLAGAYEDIVGLLASANDWITKHKDDISGAIQRGWIGVKDLVGGVYQFISDIATITSKAVTWTINIATNILGPAAKWLAGGAGPTADFGFGGLTPDKASLPATTMAANAAINAKRSEDAAGAAIEKMLKAQGPPKTTLPKAGDAGGGRGGGGGGADRMTSIIERLKEEIAKLDEGKLGGISAWANKQIIEIEKVGRKGAQTSEALALVEKASGLKKQKVTEDYNNFIAKESGNSYAEIEGQAREWAIKWKGFADAEANISKIKNRKIVEQQAKDNEEIMNLQKGMIDNLSGLTPIVSEQNALKQKSLELEIKIGNSVLDRQLGELQLKKIINDTQADELRGFRALENQMKKTNLDMEQNKGLQGWAYNRNKELGKQNTVANMMSGAENYITNAFSSGIQGVLSKDKNSLKDIGKTMFQGFIGEIHKGSIKTAFDSLAGVISPQKGGGLDQSASLLSSAGVQLGASAGGLLLSGVGIMTNSQGLVVAGTVLQLAGMAIQMYQALAGTTQMGAAMALTGSAAALSAAASMLMMSAAVDAIPFFHQGGVVYAHSGWPRLQSDEVPIIAQAGERVLSRRQNREYERGMSGGGNGSFTAITVNHAPIYNYRPTQADMNRDADMIVKAINRKLGNKGKEARIG